MLGPDAVYPLLHHVALQLCDRPLLLVHAVEVHLGQLLLQKSKKRMEAEERQDEAEPVLGGRLALCAFFLQSKRCQSQAPAAAELPEDSMDDVSEM